MPHRRPVTNPEQDKRIKYHLDPEKVSSAMKEVGVNKNTRLYPYSNDSPAKYIADKLGMDGTNRSVRLAVDRFIRHKHIDPTD